ncbi:MAG: phage tail sheath family protein [Clostridium sp.]
MNKVRPGAYINFKSAPKPTGRIGERGICTIPLLLGWGPTGIIEINSTDIVDGKLFNKIGYTGVEEDIIPLREALKNSHKVLLYRLDKTGQRASGTIGENLNVIAKYPGDLGNNIRIIIKGVTNKFSVETLFNTKVVDKQIVASATELIENSFVEFTFENATLVETPGTVLTGGTKGTVDEENYLEYLNIIKNKKFNTIGIFTDVTAVKEKLLQFVKDCRENKGKKIQLVINDYSEANYEGVISVDQGYKTLSETINVNGFVGYIAGLTAGAYVNESNTYSVIDSAIEIINPKTDEEIESAILDGKLVLSIRQDEKVVVETDINTYIGFTNDKGREFSKNRIVRTLDDINNFVKETFEKTYIGKISNNEEGRTSFKSDIISYMNEMARIGAIEEFVSEDINISKGDEIDSVVVQVGVQPIDAMEKLYMDILVK